MNLLAPDLIAEVVVLVPVEGNVQVNYSKFAPSDLHAAANIANALLQVAQRIAKEHNLTIHRKPEVS